MRRGGHGTGAEQCDSKQFNAGSVRTSRARPRHSRARQTHMLDTDTIAPALHGIGAVTSSPRDGRIADAARRSPVYTARQKAPGSSLGSFKHREYDRSFVTKMRSCFRASLTRLANLFEFFLYIFVCMCVRVCLFVCVSVCTINSMYVLKQKD